MGGAVFKHAVFGQPIAHSLSPRIHSAFAAQFGIAIEYRAIEAGVETFANELAAFAHAGGSGANVTLPLKQIAVAQCAQVTERATRSGSVNTLTWRNGEWFGDTTDGVGFVRDLEGRYGCVLAGRHTLLLGAGGAARAVACALIDAGVDSLTIANRTHERAAELATAFIGSGDVRVCRWNEISATGALDLVVNAISAGHHDGAQFPRLGGLASNAVCYDLSYGVAAQAFLAWANAAGAARVFDGLGMLVEQAAESFSIWHGRKPETQAIFDDLRREQVERSRQTPG
ncbi:MAG: shikimate dehydrogenase [Dokdonella sp.]